MQSSPEHATCSAGFSSVPWAFQGISDGLVGLPRGFRCVFRGVPGGFKRLQRYSQSGSGGFRGFLKGSGGFKDVARVIQGVLGTSQKVSRSFQGNFERRYRICHVVSGVF